jgi:hypothetical protein
LRTNDVTDNVHADDQQPVAFGCGCGLIGSGQGSHERSGAARGRTAPASTAPTRIAGGPQRAAGGQLRSARLCSRAHGSPDGCVRRRFVFHVALRDIEPAIWRRLRAPADVSLARLHDILQIAFGWTNSHLHDFLVGDVRIGMLDIEDEFFAIDEHAAPFGAVARQDTQIRYRYDFGDDWEHEIPVEAVLESGPETIECLGGARACPPEDCGGTSGYEHLVEVLSKPRHPEHKEMREWVGPRFDPERFDIKAVNKALATLERRGKRKRR